VKGVACVAGTPAGDGASAADMLVKAPAVVYNWGPSEYPAGFGSGTFVVWAVRGRAAAPF